MPNIELELDSALEKLGDQSDLTAEEEKSIGDLFLLIDDDDEMKMWRKYAKKNLLIVGLRACKLDAEVAFKSLKALHLHATKTYPELFAQVDPLNLKPVIDKKLFQIVKRPVDEGPAVIVFRIKDWKPSDCNIEQLSLTAALYVYAVAKLSPEIQRSGLILVADINGFKFSHARQASVDLVVKAVRLYSTLPPVFKGVQIINSLPLFEHTYNLFKWVLPEDIRSLINITKNDMSNLNKLMDKSMLPEEFWGSMPNHEAYMSGIEDEIMKDPQLIELIKHLQDEIIGASNLRTKKNKK